MHALFTILVQAGPVDDGLSFAEAVANVPHDPAALFVYVLLIVSFGGIFWVGRPRKTPPGAGSS